MTRQSVQNESSVGCILSSTFTIAMILIGSLLVFDVGGSSLQVGPSPATSEPVSQPPQTAVALSVETEEPTLTPLPTATAIPPTHTPRPATETPTPVETEAVTGDDAPPVAVADYDPALVSEGQSQFMLCAACHGPDARGIPNLGKNLVESEFVHSLSDEALLEFIKTGRPIWDPANTTGLDMPPKGGNPALTDEQIRAIIAYIRTLADQNAG